MFTTKLSVLAAVISFGLFAAGCAAEQTEETASSDSEVRTTQTFVDVEDGTFKLYDEPKTEPTDACDVHTVLTIAHDEAGATATLRDVVTGYCYLYVMPNERTYKLAADVNRCNTTTFSGETSVDGEARYITITDSRHTLCDRMDAQIVVDEYDGSGVVTTRYTQK